jgi:SNF2 family DNA or RNA helicase/predicted RNA methylase
MGTIIFFKAKVPGAGGADLFAETVHVQGFTNKQGRYIAPHTAIRHKKHDVPAAPDAAPDLFSVVHKEPAVPATNKEQDFLAAVAKRNKARRALAQHLAERGQPIVFTGTDGAKLIAGPDMSKPGGFRVTRFDANGPSGHYEAETFDQAIYDALRSGAVPIEPVEPTPPGVEHPAAQKLQETNDKIEENQSETPAVAAVEGVPVWGVPAGVSKRERKAFNADAVALLNAKADDQMTPDDKQVLARYSGTGGVGDSLNEFYTDPDVAAAMWQMMANCGFAGGDVLEPSSGIGVYLHTAPAGARVTAVEIDPISARIAGILHRPAGHEVSNSSLERFATQDGRLFDAVIGNVPFGVRGSTVSDDKPDMAKCETYFFDTALDKAKDGALVSFIVPTGIMDSSGNRRFRQEMLTKGEFLGAYRLPNTAFEASHTQVTSDIVMFRKRPQNIAGALGALNRDQLKAVGVWDAEFIAGKYFTDGRGVANIMGTMEEGWRAKAGMGDDITVTGSMQGVAEALARVRPEAGKEHPQGLSMAAILDVVGDDEADRRRVESASLRPPYQVAKPGDTKVVDGILYVLQGEPPRWHRAESETPAAVQDAIKIGSAIDVLARDIHGKPSAGARADLAIALDDYVRLHGLPQGNKQLAMWLNAPSLPMEPGVGEEAHSARVARLHRDAAQILGAVRQDGTYSDLITGAAASTGEATLEQVALQLALANGGFTPADLLAAYGKSDAESVKDYLFASPEFAVEADGTRWTTLDEYLSGEMWPKLDAARAALLHEGLSPEYRTKYANQVNALEKAIEPQSLESVEIMLNSGFITPEIISAWLAEKAKEEDARHPNWKATRYAIRFADGIYRLYNMDLGRYVDNAWGDADIVERFLNRSGVRKDEKEQLERVNNEFRDWLLSSDYRDQTEELYNRTYRGFRPKAFSDAPFDIPGLNPALSVNNYHFSGLRWAMEAGKGIIAADVGLGKTGRGLMLAKLAKVNGQAKRPTFVVPKSVLANWIKEAEFWFPGSKVMSIGETYKTDAKGNVTSKADDAATRRQKFQDIKQNDYDFIFISQPAWNELDVDPITKGEYVNGDFWVQRGDALGNAGDKRINAIREAYDQAVGKREFGSRENTLYFGDTGIDMLIMDEGHAYKNLYAARNRFGMNPKFLGGSGLSNRAQDTYFKARQLREAHGGKNVYMLTATPTKNSPLEVYSMLSHIAPEAFEKMGISNSEMFIDRFCEFKNDSILNLQGKIEDALVTAGFKNLGELREVMSRYIDRKTAEDVGLVLPVAAPTTHFIDMTADQELVYAELRERAAEAGKSDDTGASHIFSIMSDMGKASLDLALLGHRGTGQAPKVDACVKIAAENSKDGGQIIFCDAVDMHEKIAAKLVAAGIPRDQIGIFNAQAAASSAARQKISDQFNAGRLKFVVGNTATMGEGNNLQKGTTDIHHLDLPWDPASMQQRNGRGLRQGNTKEAVRLHTYLAKGSFDGYRFQTIQAKKDWQTLLWKGGDRVENLAREGAFSRSDMMIMLSANPEEARAKYENDKAAADARRLAEGRQDALGEFVKLQKMQTSRAALVGKKAKGDSLIRLDRRIAALKEYLGDNRYFTPKHVLESDVPALIEPNTMHAYTVGTKFEVAPGNDGPVNWSHDKPSQWVVTKVFPEKNEIEAHIFHERPDLVKTAWERDYKTNMDFDKFKAGVTPISGEPESRAA